MSSNTFSEPISAQLALFVEHLLRWNKTYRLIGESSPQLVWDKHVVDAFVAAPYLRSVRSIVDLGCGPGLPGILLKILCPWCRLTLIDSQRKRINFCESAVRTLGLSDVHVICGRAEDSVVSDRAGVAHDLVVTRATWKIHEFVVMGTKYLSNSGTLLSFKGPDWMSEVDVDTMKSHNANIDVVVPYSLLSERRERVLVVMKVG